MFKVPYPVEQRNVVKQVRVGKGYDSKKFAKLWTLVLRESGGKKKKERHFQWRKLYRNRIIIDNENIM